jgi:serine/threonine protein kinase
MNRRVGSIIEDKYKLIRLLGSGGTSAVFLAEDIDLDRLVAVKIYDLEIFQLDRDHLWKRILREAQSLAKISHPGIVSVYKVGRLDDENPFIVMEYVEGRTLREYISSEAPLPCHNAVLIALRLAEALSRAHDLGVVHRDLKPENITVEAKGNDVRIKILDFGFCKNVDRSGADASTINAVGTPGYMSPEQLLNSPVDFRSDYYALGCIIYELITGRQLFIADNVPQLIRMHLGNRPQRILELSPACGLPEQLDDFLARCLSKNPQQRFPDAGELISALQLILSEDCHKKIADINSTDLRRTEDEKERSRKSFLEKRITSGPLRLLLMGFMLAAVIYPVGTFVMPDVRRAFFSSSGSKTCAESGESGWSSIGTLLRQGKKEEAKALLAKSLKNRKPVRRSTPYGGPDSAKTAGQSCILLLEEANRNILALATTTDTKQRFDLSSKVISSYLKAANFTLVDGKDSLITARIYGMVAQHFHALAITGTGDRQAYMEKAWYYAERARKILEEDLSTTLIPENLVLPDGLLPLSSYARARAYFVLADVNWYYPQGHGSSEQAISYARKAKSILLKSDRLFTRMQAAEPTSTASAILRRFGRRQEALAELLDTFKSLEESEQDMGMPDEHLDRMVMVEQWTLLGRALEEAGDKQKAVAAYKKKDALECSH